MPPKSHVFHEARLLAVLWLAASLAPAQNTASAADPAPVGAVIDTAWPRLPGRTIYLDASSDLQAAINDASPGDEIVLPAGAAYRGPITLPRKDGSDWIVIRSSDLSAMQAGTRVGPALARRMSKIIATNRLAAIHVGEGASHYRLAGLEVTVADDVKASFGLVEMGTGTETSPDQLTSDIILDRMYIHGSVDCTCKRGASMQGIRQAIIDTYIADIHVDGQDTQAIIGWNGPGPFKIVNNYLEAAGENVMFGGSDPRLAYEVTVLSAGTSNATLSGVDNLHKGQQVMFTIQGVTGSASFTTVRSISGNTITFDELAAAPDAGTQVLWGVVPSDIQIEHNYFFKPLTWKVDDPMYAGRKWSVKNLFELKSAQRVLVNGNVFENSWPDAQSGAGILLKSANQEGRCVWCVTQDVTFTNNIIKGVRDAMTITGHESYQNPAGQPPSVSRVKIYNNLFWPSSRLFLIYNNTYDIQIEHVTGFDTYNLLMTNPESNVVNRRLVFRNNIVERRYYGAGAGSLEGNTYLRDYFSPFTWDRIVLVNTSAGTDQERDSAVLANVYPSGTTVVTGYNAVPFVDSSGKAGNRAYGLASGSPFRAAATDGKDVGVMFDALNAATAGAVDTPVDSKIAVPVNSGGPTFERPVIPPPRRPTLGIAGPDRTTL